MAEDMGEKSELPSPKRLEEARERGQIAKSQDLAAAIDLIGAVVVIVVLGGFLTRGWMEMLRRGLGSGSLSINAGELMQIVREVAMQSILSILPILAIMLVVAIIGNIAQFGVVFTTKSLEPKFDRLNPIQGLQNLYGRKNMVRSGLNIVKLAIVCIVGFSYLSRCLEEVAMLPILDVRAMVVIFG